MPEISISRPKEEDRAQWEALFRAYMHFYGQAEPAETYARAWSSLRANRRLHGFVARRGGAIVGFVHFLTHPSSTAPSDLCYLEDLFTAPEARGEGVATMLIEAVAAWARQHRCHRVYWQTQEDNAVARRLYDRLARYSGFIVYTLELDADHNDGMGLPIQR